MFPLKTARGLPGRPRQQGDRYPCGKLKAQFPPTRVRNRPVVKKRIDAEIDRAISVMGRLGPTWQTYDANPETMAAARLLAAHGLVQLAQRRTEGGFEHLISRSQC